MGEKRRETDLAPRKNFCCHHWSVETQSIDLMKTGSQKSKGKRAIRNLNKYKKVT